MFHPIGMRLTCGDGGVEKTSSLPSQAPGIVWANHSFELAIYLR
ncbi:hypothetical protein [Neorhodopirellula lusitana]